MEMQAGIQIGFPGTLVGCLLQSFISRSIICTENYSTESMQSVDLLLKENDLQSVVRHEWVVQISSSEFATIRYSII